MFRQIRLVGILLFLSFTVMGQTTPRAYLGFTPADDKTIADWKQITGYFARLDEESPKVKVMEIGRSTLGRPMIAAFISSADNIKRLDRFREINQKLADPRQINGNEELSRLLTEGKAIVSISCSIHSTEIVASQMSMQLAYELATATDAETKEILDNTILILIPSPNPDGIDIVADWYRKTLGTKAEGTMPPQLYHYYAGHDNNRDWFMLNLAETQAVTKLFWQEWFPQIVYDVHQMGQTGTRFVIPPFFDPSNPRISPSILREVGLAGYKMAADLQAKGIAGVATNTTFDTWWHGGFRSAPYYHNSIGILSEAASADLMSPVTITKEQLERARPARGLTSFTEPVTAHPDPWKGGIWRPRDIAEIEMIASRALLTLAAKYRRRYLENFYRLGAENLKNGEDDPIAYIIPAGQPAAEAVSRFAEILKWQGIEIYRMRSELFVRQAKGEDFHELPLNSFIIFTSQPQKRNILSLFEKQVYPNRVGPNGEPDPPYDVAGWTLPLQMGIETVPVFEIRNIEKALTTLEPIKDINQVRSTLNLKPAAGPFSKIDNPMRTKPRIGLYRGNVPSMDEGWTRFVFDLFRIPYRSLSDQDFRTGQFNSDVVVLPADGESIILNGLSSSRYPAELSGGIGESGAENLRKFVEDGGRLICLDDSCGFVIKRFGLNIKNVLEGLRRNQFYNPGSIVRLTVDNSNPIGRGVPSDCPAYFINSSAFEAVEGNGIRVVARYAEKDALLSGWMLGEKNLNGKAAIVEADYGKGKIILFTFRPQHRGQSWATFPLLFNALEK
ncbi:MAG: M14 family zinc carboxypeptidase [Pyrinomonadaceae bacterium]